MAAEFKRLESKSFPRLLTGCSVMEEMADSDSEKQNLSNIFPFFSTMDLDWVSLKVILVEVINLSNPSRIQLLPGIDVVMMGKSYINALIGG